MEPSIGHLKTDYRLGRNFYKGLLRDAINLMLAAAAYNFKKNNECSSPTCKKNQQNTNHKRCFAEIYFLRQIRKKITLPHKKEL